MEQVLFDLTVTETHSTEFSFTFKNEMIANS